MTEVQKTNSAKDTLLEEPSVDEICTIIEEASKVAGETKDYISYVTVLDEYLGNPKRYAEKEREQLLKKLLEVLLVDSDLVYEIAWDIPSIIIDYVETSFDFKTGHLNHSSCVQTLMSIFSLLARRGNQKELFIQSIDCLSQIQVEPLDEDDPRDAEVAERFFELKFVALFELLFTTLNHVKAQYPSRFLANASSALVTFMVEHLDTISLRTSTFILRRLFLFARDYQPIPPTDKVVPETEFPLQRRLLQRYLTDVVTMGLQKFSLKWSQRFYVELKNGVAFNDNHSPVYGFDELTLYFDDIIYRITQLAYSLDIELDVLFDELVKECMKDESETDNEPTAEQQYDLTEAKSPESIELSKEGLLLLATSARFDNRTNPKTLQLSFPELIQLTKRFLMGSEDGGTSAGVQDALCFWALWVSRKLTAKEVQTSVDKTTFISYLQMLMYIAALSFASDLRQLAYSITARLLGLHTPEVRFEYLLDTVESCPFATVREASIRMLKGFISPAPVRTDAEDVEKLSASLHKLAINHSPEHKLITLDATQKSKLETVILEQINSFEVSVDGIMTENFPILLSWANFLAVVEISPKYLKVFTEKCGKIVNSVSSEDLEEEEELSSRVTLLKMALSLLEGKL